MILRLAGGRRSLNQIESALKGGAFGRALKGLALPSADTVGYALGKMRAEQLRQYNSAIVQRARYNKVFAGGTVDGLTVAAVDGTELYSTRTENRSCPRCSVRVREGLTGYYERAVAVSYVGKGPALVIGLRRQDKGEGEITAGIALLRDLYRSNTRFCDVVVGDALYAAAPFINEVTTQGKWVIVRVKRENSRVIADAEGLFAGRGPDFEGKGVEEFKGSEYDLKIWDEEDFTSWEGVKGPLRCLRVEETRSYEKGGMPVAETTVTHIVTTCPKALVKPFMVWKIMHKRWGIEEQGIPRGENLLLLRTLEVANAIFATLLQLPEPMFKPSG